MMRSAVLLCALAALACSLETFDSKPIGLAEQKLTGQALVDYINSNSKLFRARLNKRFSSLSPAEKSKRINGLRRSVRELAELTKDNLSETRFLNLDIPESFDARTNWPACPSISYIRDQSDCGSCWAFGAVEAISDRICIATNGAKKLEISADDLLACCGLSCGYGCDGGDPIAAFQYWVSHGIVTGGNYQTESGCLPYSLPPCEHHTNATHYKKCPKDEYETPKCVQKCIPSYNGTYRNDKQYGRSAYGINARVADIQKEILTHGPVEAAFDVYEDFEHYYGGIYTHTGGPYLGGHAVRALGWGVENNVPYWLVANSWNEDWGENGYFRILRGHDECGFESAMVAGLPRL